MSGCHAQQAFAKNKEKRKEKKKRTERSRDRKVQEKKKSFLRPSNIVHFVRKHRIPYLPANMLTLDLEYPMILLGQPLQSAENKIASWQALPKPVLFNQVGSQ